MVRGDWIALGFVGGVGVLFVIFSLVQLVQGRTQSARIQKDGGSVMLSTFVMEFAYWVLSPFARVCVWLKVSPNVISTLCLLLGLLSGVALAYGSFALAGVIAGLSALMDALDGMVARARQVASDAGEVYDALVDRYTEMFFCYGLLIYYRDDVIGMLLVMLALTGSIMVSYSTAKSEAMQITDIPRGTMRRAERAVYLTAASLFAPVVANFAEAGDPHPRYYLMQGALLLVGLVANYTAIQRFYFLYRRLKK
jgi:CDP-diacylglycerol---glycerol-3-phosphate 3-phosphatidyltransferase